MNRFAFVALLATLAPVATAQPPPSPGDDKFIAFLKQCRDQYAATDAKIEKAGVRDASLYRVPGFPYLRTDRLLSSFRNELDDINTLGTWMLQLRENDSIARDIELTNLGMPKYERAALLADLRVCAVWMSYVDTDDAATRARLIDAVAVPDELPEGEPGDPAAILAAATAHRDALAATLMQPLDPKEPLALWQPAHAADAAQLPHGFRTVARDELGRVGLLMNVWPQLAAQHAPHFLLGAGDALGTPAMTQGAPTVDPAQAVVHYLPGYARINGRTLVQISYFAWFAPQLKGGPIDSRVWRVTLDDDGKPLLYDTIYGTGVDPLWFTTAPLKLRAGGEPIVAATAPDAGFAIRLQRATHAVLRLQAGTPPVPIHGYELRPYEDLQTLPAGSGTRNLFDAHGVIDGTLIHAWGRHAISRIGPRHFDDPFLIPSLFEIPPAGDAAIRDSR